MTHKPEGIREKLAAVKRLAEQGADGERENAAHMLETLLQKYGLTESDLLTSEETADVILKYSSKQEKSLAVQVIGCAKNTVSVHYRHDKKGKLVLAKCTPRQKTEIEELYTHYLKAWRNSFDDFMAAFIAANDLIPDAGVRSASDFSPEDLAKMKRHRKMAEAITSAPPARKQLASAQHRLQADGLPHSA